jgi:hypothetical protein
VLQYNQKEKERKRKGDTTMNNINERIEQLKKSIFYLEMKDHWNWHDFQDMDKMRAELHKLEAQQKAEAAQ